MDRIVIFGSGGFAREVFHLCQNLGLHQVVGFIAPELPISHEELPLPVLGNDASLKLLIEKEGINAFFCAIGDTEIRRKCFDYAENLNLKPLNIIHSSVSDFSRVLKIGCVIYPNSSIMNDCRLGKGLLVNCNVSIGHDSEIGDFCNLNPGVRIAGKVVIGSATSIGLGAVVKENVKIGKNVIVGAGSVVVKDIPDGKTVFGNPASVRS